MISNLERYKKDLQSLLDKGNQLHMSLQHQCCKDEFEEAIVKEHGEKAQEVLNSLPDFGESYQAWYSEAQSLIKQLLPDRLADFVRHYEKPKPRKEISFENYSIEDCLL